MEIAARYLSEVAAAAAAVDLRDLDRLLSALEKAYHRGRAVFAVGNGGSASSASHFAQDLSKGALPGLDGKRFRALSLTDNTSFVTALANDVGYERVFDVQLSQFAAKGDILIAISGSGNSTNVIRAVQWARRHGLLVAGFTGFDGGKLRRLSHIRIHVPIKSMCKTEAVHSIFLHMIVELLKDRLTHKAQAHARA